MRFFNLPAASKLSPVARSERGKARRFTYREEAMEGVIKQSNHSGLPAADRPFRATRFLVALFPGLKSGLKPWAEWR
jgi:hypothetical protein